MRRVPQTPEQKKRSGILMLVLAAILLIFGIAVQIHSRDITRQCSASVRGVIADVESKRVHTRSRYSSRTHTEYQAHIIIESDSPFHTPSVRSGWTRTPYRTGDPITVYYDPDDPTVYYAQGAAPQNGIALMIMGGVFLVSGMLFYGIGSSEYRRIWGKE